jgi:dTDP-4-dehydrorhamnose reductase
MAAAEPGPTQPLLVLGSRGLLGGAGAARAAARGLEVVGAARANADEAVDVRDLDALEALVLRVAPATVVNCVGLTDLAACESDPGLAYAVNARPAAALAALAGRLGFGLVHVSTDHFFTGDGDALHDEDAPVVLVNEYARSKLAGEAFALTDAGSLVVRTNIVGLRGWPGRPTFAEWALEAIGAGRPLTLFDDFLTSSLDVGACAEALLDLAARGAAGRLNVASSEVASKERFVAALAEAVGATLPPVTTGSVRDLSPRRAESLGLDVRRAEGLLGRGLPGLRETVEAIATAARSPA